jgi:transposase
MAAFEQACKDNGLALFVLPPKRPDLNGAVERA